MLTAIFSYFHRVLNEDIVNRVCGSVERIVRSGAILTEAFNLEQADRKLQAVRKHVISLHLNLIEHHCAYSRICPGKIS